MAVEYDSMQVYWPAADMGCRRASGQSACIQAGGVSTNVRQLGVVHTQVRMGRLKQITSAAVYSAAVFHADSEYHTS